MNRESLLLHVLALRSSTHCELLALELALGLQLTQVLTDSLCVLQLLRGWGSMPETRRLCCPDWVEVYRVLAAAKVCILPVTLEKVRAHDDFGVQRMHRRGCWLRSHWTGWQGRQGAGWRALSLPPGAVAMSSPRRRSSSAVRSAKATCSASTNRAASAAGRA